MDDDPSLAERFEFFAAGMELGNAYSEINDAEKQQRRFDEQSEHVEGVPGDPDYVEALSYGMPPTGGSRPRHRPLDDAPLGPRHDPRRDPVPRATPGLSVNASAPTAAYEAAAGFQI